jgi:hypothetical protein
MLRFQIRLRQVLAEDADGEELDAAQEQDDADERGPALHGIAEEEVAHDDEEDGAHRDEAAEDAADGRDDEGFRREGDDPFHGVGEEPPETPFRLAGHARRVFKFDPFRPESDPAEKAFGETVVFFEGEERIDEFPVHEAEIGGAVHEIGIGNAVHDFIKSAREEGADGRLAFACDAACRGRVVAFFGDGAVHFGEKCRRMLQIGVHEADVIARRRAHAGQHGRFLAEISGKGNPAHVLIFFGELFHDGKGIVAGSVVDENQLKRDARHFTRRFLEGFVKIRQCVLFIETGDNHGNQISHLAHSAAGRIFSYYNIRKRIMKKCLSALFDRADFYFCPEDMV